LFTRANADLSFVDTAVAAGTRAGPLAAPVAPVVQALVMAGPGGAEHVPAYRHVNQRQVNVLQREQATGRRSCASTNDGSAPSAQQELTGRRLFGDQN
jgi:hypothetical protein